MGGGFGKQNEIERGERLAVKNLEMHLATLNH